MIAWARAAGTTLLMTGTVMASGCATPPSAPVAVSPQEQQARDRTLGQRVAADLEGHLRFRKDLELEVFLRRIAERLSAGEPSLKDSPVGVFIVQDSVAHGRNFSLPGNRIYLSAGQLRDSRFENELAAAIALELAHLGARTVIRRLERKGTGPEGEWTAAPLRGPDYFGEAGLFAFSDEEWADAAIRAIRLLYAAGYDPRGMTTLCDRYAERGTRSPFDPRTLAVVRAQVRAEIARFSPLRNPIVRSEDFIRLQDRMQRL